LHTERSWSKRAAKLPLYRWFIPKVDACCAVGAWSRDYFLHYGARPERVFVVPHVVDGDFFRQEAERLRSQKAELRREWQLDDEATVFLFAGKFVEKKRPLDFVRAIVTANNDGKRIMGLMVGDGPRREACEDEARSTSAPIRFAGFLNQSKMPMAYAAADALVLPSEGETWGMVVNEAMASGKPSFVSDHVGCGPDLIAPGETGAIFPVGDIAALSSLLSSSANRQRELQEMGVKAQQAAARYSIAAAVDGVMDAIDAVRNGTRN